MSENTDASLAGRGFFKPLEEGVLTVELIARDGQVAKKQIDQQLRNCEYRGELTDDQLKNLFQFAETTANAELIATLTNHLQDGKPIDAEVRHAYTNLELLAKANQVIKTGQPVLGTIRQGTDNKITEEAERPDVTFTKAINALDPHIDAKNRLNVKAILQKQAISLGQSISKSAPLPPPKP